MDVGTFDAGMVVVGPSCGGKDALASRRPLYSSGLAVSLCVGDVIASGW